MTMRRSTTRRRTWRLIAGRWTSWYPGQLHAYRSADGTVAGGIRCWIVR